jgi:hypothetical protein
MKYLVEITDAALSDGELYAAVLLIINLPGCPDHAKARAIRALIPSITGHAAARIRGDRGSHAPDQRPRRSRARPRQGVASALAVLARETAGRWSNPSFLLRTQGEGHSWRNTATDDDDGDGGMGGMGMSMSPG